LVEGYQEELVSLEELRERMPDLRKKQAALRAQLDALEAETLNRETYVALAENLEKFLRRSRTVPKRPRSKSGKESCGYWSERCSWIRSTS